jgi:23S rRNA (cytidine1920-2'-O)/16S rRNA (cytidine1409-2'-O)-methyltransferase
MTKKAPKERVDALLVARGLAASIAEAQALILAGIVTSDTQRIDKAGALLRADAKLEVARRKRFVSRGGDKLDSVLDPFVERGLVIEGAVCIDVGASTGGFTDCLLQRGAARVFAVDVGYGQLAPKLRDDPRVVVRERVNARDLEMTDFDAPIDLVVVDASFIALGKLAPAIARVSPAGAALVALVKPQFEADREDVSKGKGVIRDEATRLEAIERAREDLQSQGYLIVHEVDSAVHGPKGNVERFVFARRTPSPSP